MYHKGNGNNCFVKKIQFFLTFVGIRSSMIVINSTVVTNILFYDQIKIYEYNVLFKAANETPLYMSVD